MHKRFILRYFICAFLLLGSLPTITGQEAPRILFESIPSGANVLLNEKLTGITPYAYTYNLNDGKRLEFRVELPDYQGERISIRPIEKNARLLLNAFLFHIPGIFIKQTAADYTLPESAITMQLYKIKDKDELRVKLPRVETVFEIENGKSIGNMGKRQMTGKQSAEIYSSKMDLDQYISRGFAYSWIDDVPILLGTNQSEKFLSKSRYYLKPVVNKIDADLTSKKNRVKGSLTLGVDWEFFKSDSINVLAFTLSRTTVYRSYGDYTKSVIKEALEQASKLLSEEDTLRTLLKGLNDLAGFSGDELAIEGEASIDFLERKDMLSTQIKSVVTVKTGEGHGSGFFIDRKGHILTNQHVIGGNTEVTVVTNGGLEMKAQVLRQNEKGDLALLKVDILGMVPLPLATDGSIVIGEDLYAIGTPMDNMLGQSVSRGILSGKREIRERLFLQTDVSINPGNSGGPVLNDAGEVVGIATLKIADVGIEGLGFAIPIEEALKMLNLKYTQEN